MQYLMLDGNETLTSLSKSFGQSNVSAILADNGIRRTPNVAKEWKKTCQTIIERDTREVTATQKMTMLNRLTDSEDVFEKACLMDDNEWKVFAATQSFTDALRVPESIVLPSSSKILGSGLISPISTTPNNLSDPYASTLVVRNTTNPNRTIKDTTTTSSVRYTGSGPKADMPSNPVPTVTYRKVMDSLKKTGDINPGIFNTVNTGPGVNRSTAFLKLSKNPVAFNLPWGRIQMYSTLLDEVIDFPVYPEQVEIGRQASYTSMPDTIYQYEPWVIFQGSGPREQSLEFHMHRDMWSGDHRDGQANKLIRFCEANTFAEYNGSAVRTPTVKFFMDGSLFISGVLKNTNTRWSGPLGLDNWWLEFTLSLVIQEVSTSALNIHAFRKRKLKEG